MGFGLVTGFIEHLRTQPETASNYSTITKLHTLQITRAHTESSQSAFNSHCLATAFNSGDCSVSVLMPLPAG
jgi:hypothetical protein